MKEITHNKIAISLRGIDPILLLGYADENLSLITNNFTSQITARNDRIRISGPESEIFLLKELFNRLINLIKDGEILTKEIIKKEIEKIKSPVGQKAKVSEVKRDERTISTPRRTIQPKTENQTDYLKAIDDYDIVISIGPAGTGKTYLAVAKALQALVAGKISRIILTRPAVEAGESLGYLPGNFKEKVDPYLRPLYDALYDMMPLEKIKRLIEEEVIEVAPLAYMRGRTLSDAYIILDEAQNTTSTQMKMFLTRLGWNSKAIVTGDITQIDLERKASSGLVEIIDRLKSVKGIKFIYFNERDVVRPRLVSEIIRAYEEYENKG